MAKKITELVAEVAAPVAQEQGCTLRVLRLFVGMFLAAFGSDHKHWYLISC